MRHLLIAFLSVILIVSGCRAQNSLSEYHFDMDSILRNEKVEDLVFTLYYSPYLNFSDPIDKNQLIAFQANDDFVYNNENTVCQKVVIKGHELEKHLGLFYIINDDVLVSAPSKSFPNVSFYYTLESIKSGVLLEVEIWHGYKQNMLVNGEEVIENKVFYDVLKAFLPVNTYNQWEKYIR